MAKRILTASIALVITLFAILATPPFISALLLAVAIICALEIAKLTGIKAVTAGIIAAYTIFATLLIDAAVMTIHLTMPDRFNFDIGVTLIMAIAFWLAGSYSLIVWKPNYNKMAYGIVFWVCGSSLSAIYLHLQSFGEGSFAPNLLLLAIVPLWVGDSLAYFIGKKWGKRKLAPSISPKKTIEGAVANLVGCLVTAVAVGQWLEIPLTASIAVGFSTGILGQVGDLLQSRFKRRADVKDSGTLLPGHGGFLDRLDSFLFSSVPSLLLLLVLSPELFHVKHWPF